MSYYPQQQQQQNPGYGTQNLQFFPSSYGNQVSGHSTPAQAQYGAPQSGYGNYGGASGFISTPPVFPGASGVSGRMGEQGGLRTGWLAAFGTEGYEGEPPLLEEIGVNWGHIKSKVGLPA